MFKNISVKQKLWLLLGSAVLGLTALGLLNYIDIMKMDQYGKTERQIEMLKSDMLTLRRNEKDFILRKDLKYKKKFAKNFAKTVQGAKSLQNKLDSIGLDDTQAKKFLSIVQSYQKDFYAYIDKQVEIGLDEKKGLYGKLRKTVHNVEDTFKMTGDAQSSILLLQLRRAEKDFMLRKDEKYVAKFNQIMNTLINRTKVNNALIVELLEDYKKDFLSLVETEKVIGLSHKDGLQGKLRNTIHKTEDLIKKIDKDTIAQIKNKKQNIVIVSIIASLVVIVLLSIFILAIATTIGSSVKKFQSELNSFFSYLNKETQEVQLLDDSSKDEFGTMAKEINRNIQKTQSSIKEDEAFIVATSHFIKEIKSGNNLAKLNATTNNPTLKELQNLLEEMRHYLEHTIARDINMLVDVLTSFKNQDYTARFPDPYATVAIIVNEVGDVISEILVQNKRDGITLDDSAQSLLKEITTLNSSSNEAAASLEETAAALEQITTNISSNTENVVKMSSYAKELSDSSNHGNNLAKQTSSSMDKINEQVNSINEAISVIDQIAFQTNILSLNAAVEAATAGEAGKGFAVVAQEVRNLATRSAEAAKEIKDLVQNATTKADEGKTIADEMIEGYVGLNENISNTLELIKNVESASKEQKQGIEQINDAVALLDQKTQENAQVASHAQDIANNTSAIASKIVEDADKKEYAGKDDFERRKKPIDPTYSGVEKRKIENKIKLSDSQKTTTTIKPIDSDDTIDDEWASF